MFRNFWIPAEKGGYLFDVCLVPHFLAKIFRPDPDGDTAVVPRVMCSCRDVVILHSREAELATQNTGGTLKIEKNSAPVSSIVFFTDKESVPSMPNASIRGSLLCMYAQQLSTRVDG